MIRTARSSTQAERASRSPAGPTGAVSLAKTFREHWANSAISSANSSPDLVTEVGTITVLSSALQTCYVSPFSPTHAIFR